MPMNPYQGLKRSIQPTIHPTCWSHNANESLSGIETGTISLDLITMLRHNANESLSGIETWGQRLPAAIFLGHNANESLSGIETCPIRSPHNLRGVTMPMNPYQGLKL